MTNDPVHDHLTFGPGKSAIIKTGIALEDVKVNHGIALPCSRRSHIQTIPGAVTFESHHKKTCFPRSASQTRMCTSEVG